MGKVLHKVFKPVVNDISQVLPVLGESGSEVSYFIPGTRNFAEVTRLSEYIKKPWLKTTLKDIKNLINDHRCFVKEPEKGEPVAPCMDVYKSKIQYDGSLDKVNLIIVVRGYKKNKELVGDTWSPTASMRTLKYLLAYAVKHKAIVHQLNFIGALLWAEVKNRVFVKLDSRYADYFPEYSNYFEET